MTEKELKKLNRVELLELLLDSYKENAALRSQLTESQRKLQEREICIQNAGSIAEASLQLNEVFTAAQAAAEQYVSNVKSRWEATEAVCQAREIETAERSRRILEEAEKHAVEMEEEAKRRSQSYWDAIYGKLQEIINEHSYLKVMFQQVDSERSGLGQ